MCGAEVGLLLASARCGAGQEEQPDEAAHPNLFQKFAALIATLMVAWWHLKCGVSGDGWGGRNGASRCVLKTGAGTDLAPNHNLRSVGLTLGPSEPMGRRICRALTG